MKKRGQVSFEYMVIVGFISFVIVGVLGMAFYYSSGIQDRMKIVQMNNFGNKVISTAESVFYSGEPSKATITGYVSKGMKDIKITQNNLVMSLQTSTGVVKTAFPSDVNITGNINSTSGMKKVEIVAEENQVKINQI